MGLPVVSTTIGAEGLPIRHDVHAMVTDDAASFAGAVVRLLQVPDHAARIAGTGAAYVREQFGWDRVAAEFTRRINAP